MIMSTFEMRGTEFLLDGKPFRILAGAMHYFRIHPALWEDRFRKMKALGLNTLETYTAWNLHEPRPGEFHFTEFGDLERYLSLARQYDLKVIVRPGPYICSEWEFGALPGWLTAIPGIRLRCFNRPYLEAVERYFDELLPRINRFSCRKDGPVIAVQVENEYGSYGNDKRYLLFLSDLLSKHLPGIMQLTSDGPNYAMLNGGTLSGVWATGNFGSKAANAFEELEKFQPGKPKMCCEFWNGWFDHWGEKHHSRSPEDAGNSLREILEHNGNVSLYMFHGGTNFGFFNGANCIGPKQYQPTVSSYDDDAPLNENGGITPKYEMFRKILAEFGSGIDLSVPPPPTLPVKAFGKVALTEQAPLLKNLNRLSKSEFHATPPCMEELGQSLGFILYRTKLIRDIENEPVVIDEPRDRALVYLNGTHEATVYCNDESHEFSLSAKEGDILEILVENMGRANYGPFMERNARKGITDGVRVGNQFQFGWEVFPLPLEDLSCLEYRTADRPLPETPCFYKGEFQVEEPADTFLRIPGKKGIAFLNGFNLGRYWEIGPTHTLYLPAPLLRKGSNRLEILELHQLESPEAELTDTPEL